MLYTVGHSTLSIEDFIELLQSVGIKRIIDVRKLPGSVKFPQFNEDQLRESLGGAGIKYGREARLAGLRGKTPGVGSDINGNWQNASFHRYADYALQPEFEAGLRDSLELIKSENAAYMCSEALWWRCHRRIIADHLLAKGFEVQHLMPGGKTTPATLTPGANTSTGSVTYPV